MKKNNKYIYLFAATVLLFVLVHLLGPKQFDWTPTFSSRDKNPFGAYVLNEMLVDIFPDQAVYNNNLTFYEFADSLSGDENIFAIASYMSLEDEDTRALMSKVEGGANAFLSASHFSGLFADTLGLYTKDVLFNMELKDIQILQDTSFLRFKYGRNGREFLYKRSDINTFFTALDSIQTKAYVIAENEYGDAVTLRVPWGEGQFIINSTPLAFTNNYLLYANHRLIAQTLSYLPPRPVWWTEYYQLGRLESGSPLRVILKSKALSWAYYTLLIVILVFIIFEGKRKQRIIPVIKPLANSSLEFIRTIGNMYIQAGNHKAVAEKMINHFIDYTRSVYFLPAESHAEFAELLARKSGNSKNDTEALLSLIKVVQRSPSIPVEMLLDLNKKIESFNHSPLRNTIH